MPEEEMVVDLGHGHVVIVAHPGQQVPTDTTVLRQSFATTPDRVIPRSKSSAALPLPVDDDSDTDSDREASDTAKRGARNTAKTPPPPVTGA